MGDAVNDVLPCLSTRRPRSDARALRVVAFVYTAAPTASVPTFHVPQLYRLCLSPDLPPLHFAPAPPTLAIAIPPRPAGEHQHPRRQSDWRNEPAHSPPPPAAPALLSSPFRYEPVDLGREIFGRARVVEHSGRVG